MFRFSSVAKLTGFLVALVVAFGGPAWAESIDTAAREAYIIDFNTGTVLLDKNGDNPMTPSSMTKLMTVYLAFARLKDGSLRMTDQFPVSETAWKKHYKSGGSLMFLPVHSMVKVDDLLRGIIIQSGNDACSVLAEGLSGSEDAFAEQMTEKAKQLGMTHSTFKNASGWPEPGHQTTAHDLAILASHLIRDFPEYYPIFAERSYVFNNIKQDNRNPLIWENVAGADGLKTGHTEDGGYGLVGSAIRDGRRIIIVLNGMTSIKQRAEESSKLIEWAFREFEGVKIYKAGDTVTTADVWLGQSDTVPLTVSKDIVTTVKRTSRHDLKVVASYNGPLAAPIKKGTQVGTLLVTSPGFADIQVPLLAGADVDKLGFSGRIGAAIKHILWGGKS